MKNYQSSDNGLTKIKKLVVTKPRQKSVQIPLYNEDEYEDDDIDDLEEYISDN